MKTLRTTELFNALYLPRGSLGLSSIHLKSIIYKWIYSTFYSIIKVFYC